MNRSEDPILSAFGDLVQARPDAPVVVRGECRVSREDTNELARRTEAVLAGAGVPEGAIVGLDASNAAGFLAGLLALRRRRCGALLLEGAGPLPESLRAAADLRAAGVLHCGARWSRIGFEFLPTGGISDDERVTAGGREPEIVGPDIAVIKRTSGSTGAPEGILTPVDALVADDVALARSMSLQPDERIVAAVPLSHSYGLSSIVMPALMRGATIVVPRDTSPVATVLAAERLGATFLPTVPAYLAALVRLSSPPRLGSALRRVVAAGAPLTAETAVRFRAVFGRPVHVFYGASECGGIAYDREGGAAERGTVGMPVDGVRVELGSSRTGEGAVTVRSPAVARSYFPRSDDRLAGGLFRSSDLGRWRGSELQLVGRTDDLINVRGRKVNPREVESVLRRVPGVDEVVAIGVRSASGDDVLGSVVAARVPIREVDLRDACRRELADHKVPRSFVLVDELPRNARGKVDREAVRRLGDAGAGRPRADHD